jgi:hypothetical protein
MQLALPNYHYWLMDARWVLECALKGDFLLSFLNALLAYTSMVIDVIRFYESVWLTVYGWLLYVIE